LSPNRATQAQRASAVGTPNRDQPEQAEDKRSRDECPIEVPQIGSPLVTTQGRDDRVHESILAWRALRNP
jgi:hypothetical protein